MTDKQISGALLVVAFIVIVAAGSCYEHDRRDCKSKHGELYGWRERICVKPGSVIE